MSGRLPIGRPRIHPACPNPECGGYTRPVSAYISDDGQWFIVYKCQMTGCREANDWNELEEEWSSAFDEEDD